jgi:hypothetical protein
MVDPKNDTPPTLTRERLDEIVRRLVAALAPARVYLFGSHAYGQPHQGSDVDVMVVLPGPVPPVSVCYRQGYACLRGMGLPIELHFASLDGFDRRRTVRGSLEHEIGQRGSLVYANKN